jgi:hypothetical protein
MAVPGSLFLWSERSQHADQSLVEELCESISLRVIRRCSGLRNPGHRTELFDHLAPEVRALIGVQSPREPVVREELVEKNLCRCPRRLVARRECLGVARKMVCNHQDVLKASRRRF